MLPDHDFAGSLNELLSEYEDCDVKTTEDLIAYNKLHQDLELPPGEDGLCTVIVTVLTDVEYPGQQDLEAALNDKLPTEKYEDIKRHIKLAAKTNGIDKTLKDFGIDVIIGPMDGRIPTVAAAAGYPVGAMPLGYSNSNGRPFGLAVVAAAGNEGLMLQAMSAWEKMRPKRQPPPQMVALTSNTEPKI